MSEYKIDNGELKHYGVIGMKWGIRRAKKKGTTYEYRSHATNVYSKKADKARKKGDNAKAKKYDAYTKRSKELDKKMQDYASSVSAGKAVAQAFLLNSRTYAAAKMASGNSKIVSRGLGFVTSAYAGGLGDMAARYLYVRGYDDKYVKKQISQLSK